MKPKSKVLRIMLRIMTEGLMTEGQAFNNGPLIMMGLKMAEQMMSGKKKEGK